MSPPAQNQTNRAIVLTPCGPAAIAVVRLIGPAVPEFLRDHFSKEPKAGRCVHGILSDGPRIIDDPVIVWLPENAAADVNQHGGTWVVRSMLDLAVKCGFEIVEPKAGEPALDGADGGTLLEREVAAHLPLARTELALRALLAQVRAWERLQTGSPTPGKIRQVLADNSLMHLLHPPSVAIVGAANVGKSTLANQLFGQERSITADIAGTTRDWVGEIANVNGLPVMLVDTPGLRTTDDAIEHAAIERGRARIEMAELIVLVLDATRPLEPDQAPLLNAYPRASIVVNKCDRSRAWEELEKAAIHTAAITGQGVDDLRRAIAGYFGCADVDAEAPRCWTQRQREILFRAVDDITALEEL
jgi:small GTP-binding protein